MRFTTVNSLDGTWAARLDGNTLVGLEAPDVGDLLRRGIAEVSETGRRADVTDVELAPVVLAPSKIICVGVNYLSHVREVGMEPPAFPTLFAKFARALIGPRDPIVLPSASRAVDWEVELAFVVGRAVRDVQSDDEALDAIAGYTVLNDVSMRDWQVRTEQWLQGKTFEASTPVGPALVSPDEIDHARALAVSCEVDGETVQKGSTADLIFPPAALVRYVSQFVTLDPGDLITTGTPSGIGASRQPPRYLQAGQHVRTTIEGIGSLENTCRVHDGS
jgi:acylpyruvate hydrolase